MLLHLCQPSEPGSEELGRMRPNGGVMYLGTNEVSKRSPISDEPLMVPRTSNGPNVAFGIKTNATP